MPRERELDTLQRGLDITFHNRDLLLQAMVHRSYINENPESQQASNERLEFLGDAILDFLAAEFLYRQHPDKSEGDLTQLRTALVRTETLAGLAQELGLGRHLVMARGEEKDEGRSRPTILADAFEALLGAIYLDKGIEAARAFVEPFFQREAQRLHGRPPIDHKSALQIAAQGRLALTPHYRTVAAWGPDHDRRFRVEVLIGERALGQGEGPSKQAAQQQAARVTLERLREEWT